jgi:hypothetical protein
MDRLRVRGKDIVGPDNRKVFLRGVCLGGWLNLENFLLGFSGTESALRAAFLRELGPESSGAFFKAFHDSFVTEADFGFLRQLGATAVRLPVNYRMIEGAGEWDSYGIDGFSYIDSAVEWGVSNGIYIILDLHAAPGCQNRRWHSDNATSSALLWSSTYYQDLTCGIWRRISERYKGEATIAGYDLLNEPEADEGKSLRSLYDRIIQTLRSNGDEHIVFLEGNRRGEDFTHFDDIPGGNIAFSTHNYSGATLLGRRYPGMLGGDHVDKGFLERAFQKRNAWVLEREVPSFVGEFGVLLDGSVGSPLQADLSRIHALKDFLEVLNAHEQHWTLWSYKDLVHQGLLVASESSSYRKALSGFLKLKEELALDTFIARKSGGVSLYARTIVDRIAELVGRGLGDYSLNYQSLLVELGEQNLAVTVGNFLLPLFVAAVSGFTPAQMNPLLNEAFGFEHCERRHELIDVVRNAL